MPRHDAVPDSAPRGPLASLTLPSTLRCTNLAATRTNCAANARNCSSNCRAQPNYLSSPCVRDAQICMATAVTRYVQATDALLANTRRDSFTYRDTRRGFAF